MSILRKRGRRPPSCLTFLLPSSSFIPPPVCLLPPPSCPPPSCLPPTSSLPSLFTYCLPLMIVSPASFLPLLPLSSSPYHSDITDWSFTRVRTPFPLLLSPGQLFCPPSYFFQYHRSSPGLGNKRDHRTVEHQCLSTEVSVE